MFCHQCQETMRNSGCNAAKGVCGKADEVSNLQDLVLHVCKGIGFWGTKALEQGVWREDAALIVDRILFATITNANFAASDFERWIGEALKVRDDLKGAYVGAGGKTPSALPDAATWTAGSVEEIRAAARTGTGGWAETANGDIRALRSLIAHANNFAQQTSFRKSAVRHSLAHHPAGSRSASRLRGSLGTYHGLPSLPHTFCGLCNDANP